MFFLCTHTCIVSFVHGNSRVDSHINNITMEQVVSHVKEYLGYCARPKNSNQTNTKHRPLLMYS